MIKVTPIGPVDELLLDEVRSTAVDFYSKAGGEPPLLEIYVYSSQERMRAELLKEAEGLGVAVVGDFIALHEAWRGWPRIHVSYEAYRSVGSRVFRALLLHELAHSKLHGSPYYYVISLNRSLTRRYGKDALVIEYTASTAVKDLEVLKLLKNLGYRDEIESYAEFVKIQIGGVQCHDMKGLLELVKLSLPFFIGGLSLANLNPSCADVAGKVLDVVEKLARVEGDLDEKIIFLVKELEKILQPS
mgnify:CR=1 FL=1